MRVENLSAPALNTRPFMSSVHFISRFARLQIFFFYFFFNKEEEINFSTSSESGKLFNYRWSHLVTCKYWRENMELAQTPLFSFSMLFYPSGIIASQPHEPHLSTPGSLSSRLEKWALPCLPPIQVVRGARVQHSWGRRMHSDRQRAG